MRLIWRGTALNDLKGIISYISERNVSAARRLQADIEACAERLPDHPFMYRRGRVPGTREAVVHPNYILVYRVAADAIEVVNVLHSRRQYP
ncbi:type II toxin-antitoxin system RelE/ParE family toxin [Sphingomonas sp.]|uniref:type II toxin-antitoxin system RelE/ParE family toxin n=1 Tax=Sphingomonas sp. TaxID=28214 RepID=UPI0035C85EB1